MRWHLFNRRKRHFSPPVVIASSFLLLIFVGTLLLKLPISTVHSISWVDALFTATSATTVTGLSVFDPGATLTLFGELLLLTLIQMGGVGLMAFAVAVLILMGKKVGLQNRIYIQESFNQLSVGGTVKFLREILLFVFVVEGFAVGVLAAYWVPKFGWQDGIYYSVFHVISAFNNAGFSLFADNLTPFAGDPVVTIVLSSLFIVGGIGFVVVMEVVTKRSIRQWSLHTKMMISGTILLNLLSTIVFFVLEYNNMKTLGQFSFGDKLLTAYFQAVTPRTAGFNMISIGDMEESSLLYTLFLMFIGGGSASTASGIKLTTFMVIVVATISYFRGLSEPHLYGKSIKIDVVFRSLAIAAVSSMLVFGSLFLLTLTERIPLLPLAFETFSAFGTVGLSMGITSSISPLGEVILCIVMFLGRIGPLTVFFLLIRPKKEKYRFSYDRVHTG